MNNLKLLIVDDCDDNRLVLKTICKKLENFEMQEAVDGINAIEIVEKWNPHIILMDIMMPNLDGFEASKIIKERYPEVVIIVVTAVNDSRMEDKMNQIGVDIYLQKPVDRKLIHYKLESIGSSLRSKLGQMKTSPKKSVLNPFNSDIRSFKTFFEITDEEAAMDFGMWLFDQFNGKLIPNSNHFNSVLDVFYKLMSQGIEDSQCMSIIVEESYEEFYITLKFDTTFKLKQKVIVMLDDLETEHVVKENIVCVRLSKAKEIVKEATVTPKEVCKNLETEEIKQSEETKQSEEKKVEEKIELVAKEVRVIDSKERELLHQNFVNKTSAVDYVSETGGDVIDEILDLSSIDEEWIIYLREIEKSLCADSLVRFADSVLNVYVRAINNLFEFTALAYALSSLSVFIKNSAGEVSQDPSKMKMLIVLLEHLGTDLTSWREHIFILQDTEDIHYLDSSFFSSCMQIEGIISDKKLGHDDENEMEFF